MSVGTQVALLIDGENVSPGQYANIEKAAREYGHLAVKRVCGDWSAGNMAGWRRVAAERGLYTVHQPQQGKNVADATLIIDAVDLFHTRHDVEVFCVVSSDLDFAPLCLWLRERGRCVVGIGEDKSRTELRAACSEFLVLPRREQRSDTDPGSVEELCEGVIKSLAPHYGFIAHPNGDFYFPRRELQPNAVDRLEGSPVRFLAARPPNPSAEVRKLRSGLARKVEILASAA